jgi:hypothetical protein
VGARTTARATSSPALTITSARSWRIVRRITD